MAWKPWYERMVDIDTAEEREEFLKGVFNAPRPSAKTAGSNALAALMAGWGVSKIVKSAKK